MVQGSRTFETPGSKCLVDETVLFEREFLELLFGLTRPLDSSNSRVASLLRLKVLARHKSQHTGVDCGRYHSH